MLLGRPENPVLVRASVVHRGRDTGFPAPPGGRGGHPSPAPTEHSVQFYRITLFFPCSRLSRPQSNISPSDCDQVIRSSFLYRLVGPYKLRLNLAALPCSGETPRRHASG